MTNAEILIKILKSLMFDGWKLDSNMTVTQTKDAIERTRGEKSLRFAKENHQGITVNYCTDNTYPCFLTSWYVEYYNHKKSDYTVTRLVAHATNKQVRSFLTRLDKVQESKALSYRMEQEAKRKQKEEKDWVTEYMEQNCPVTWEGIVASQKAFNKSKQAVMDKASELNKEYAETVDDEVQRYNSYKQAVSFKCDFNLRWFDDWFDDVTDWKKSYDHYIKRMYWDTSEVRLVTDQDFTDLAKHIVNVQEQTHSLISHLESMLKEGLQARATWNQYRQQAIDEWSDNNN